MIDGYADQGYANRAMIKKPPRRPTGAELKSAREAIGMTQEQAANLLSVSVRTWQGWEQGQEGRKFPPQMLELFKLKTKGSQS